jgi:formylglycine-generating enzyme required for sulfatase activity
MSVGEISASMLSAAGLPVGNWTGDQPACINWFQAAGFTNWMNTSTGHQPAYRLNAGLTVLTLWSSADACQAGGENLYRHKDAYYFLPSEDEWYKAAYHQNNGSTADYWDYATASNSVPASVASGVGAGTAVYHRGSFSTPTDVQISGGASAYGTMGQGGNVWEWTESANDGTNDSGSEFRAFRGGFWNSNESNLRASSRNYNAPSVVDYSVGFRVASVPEPSALAILLVGLLALVGRRNRP